MKRLLVISFALVFPFAAAPQQRARRPPNRPPSIESFTSSLKTIQICPFFPTSAVLDKPEVQLEVKAIDPDGDALLYEYSTTEGTISGEGRSVVWDLRGLPRGPHEVLVAVSDGYGGKAEKALTVTTIDSGSCDPPPPPCPVIKVSCPDEMEQTRPFIFSATIESTAEGYMPSSFHWKLNAGRIIKGQHTREIEATTEGAVGFEKITATVEVGGFDPSCTGTIVSCSTKIIR